MEDWPLHAYLWSGKLPEDEDESNRITKLSEKYRAHNDELQVFFPHQSKLTMSG